jgi:hypothetical protein
LNVSIVGSGIEFASSENVSSLWGDPKKGKWDLKQDLAEQKKSANKQTRAERAMKR